MADAPELGIDFVDMGEHRLKSLTRPEHLFLVTGEGLSSERTIRSDAAIKSNLPVAHSRFVGRKDDLQLLRGEVAPGRVATLTGPGGAGKTRTSLEVARLVATDYPDGVWWCDLSPLTDGDSIGPHLAAILAVNLETGMSPTESIVEALGSKRVLFVIDNCEQVLAGAADTLGSLLDGCPGLAAIATSREPLNIAGEVNWPLRPMDTSTEAVDLLIERATAAGAHGPTHDAWDPDELRELCAQLDGMPLAIEMAAARLRSLSPTEIISRLEDRFRLLRSNRRDDNPRQTTLLATLDWSYDLLDPDEQLLLDRLGVFAGTFDLASAEAVCADDNLDEYDIIDLLGQLVDKSLVMAQRGNAAMRYRLLETIRHYGLRHLDERQQLVELRARHLQHVTQLMAGAAALYEHHDYWKGKSIYDENFDNLRAAMNWAIERGDSAACDQLFHDCAWYLFAMLPMEVQDWAIAATTLESPGPYSHGIAAFFSAIIGDYATAVERATIGVELLESPYQEGAELVYGPLNGGLSGSADPLLVAAAVDAATAGKARGGAGLVFWEGAASICLSSTGSDPAATAVWAENAIAGGAALNNPLAAAGITFAAAATAMTRGIGSAIELCRQAVDLAEAGELIWYPSLAANTAAQLAARAGLEEAPSLLAAAISRAQEHRIWFDAWPTVRAASTWLYVRGHQEIAAVVHGYLVTQGLAGVRGLTNLELVPEIAAASRRGASMHRDDVVDMVIETLRQTTPDAVTQVR